MPRINAARRASREVRPGVETLDARLVLSLVAPAPKVATSLPSDPDLARQWGLNDPADVDINAPEAWRATTGSASTIVAVLDSGVDAANPEFRNRLWVNPAASGRGKPAYGWNFVGNNADVRDDYGHGTHVAGIIGAARDGKGIVGVDWNARLMILKVLDSRGGGDPAVAAAAVRFAADNGARVISVSWALDVYSQDLYDAIAHAGSRGAVVVVSAGNQGVNGDLRPVYPASFDLPNILVVAAVDRSGALASFSNYGAGTVDVAAPGVDVYSTFPSRSRYATLSGTSMAVPHVAGVVSLVVARHPDWSAERIVEHVKATVKPVAALAGVTSSGGIVDAAKAVGAPTSNPAPPIYPTATPPPRRGMVVAREVRPRPLRPAPAPALAARTIPAFQPRGVRMARA
ncbi:S8 family peptidase [Paludisphaera sp.]|uniref:S8 family peptidase n=1 Tax=Paludisphaera sp. TaxID=2017432 RepID=UPI00301B935E